MCSSKHWCVWHRHLVLGYLVPREYLSPWPSWSPFSMGNPQRAYINNTNNNKKYHHQFFDLCCTDRGQNNNNNNINDNKSHQFFDLSSYRRRPKQQQQQQQISVILWPLIVPMETKTTTNNNNKYHQFFDFSSYWWRPKQQPTTTTTTAATTNIIDSLTSRRTDRGQNNDLTSFLVPAVVLCDLDLPTSSGSRSGPNVEGQFITLVRGVEENCRGKKDGEIQFLLRSCLHYHIFLNQAYLIKNSLNLMRVHTASHFFKFIIWPESLS